MIPKECKRLAEVNFPIAVVSKHAALEKSIRHGDPPTPQVLVGPGARWRRKGNTLKRG
jgi:adenine-specific DNA methylase